MFEDLIVYKKAMGMVEGTYKVDSINLKRDNINT